MTRTLALLTLGLALAACQSEIRAGASCTRASDCASPLLCASGRCREACAADRDCPPSARCFFSHEVGVCELPMVDVCDVAGACVAPLVCVSGHCSEACASATTCGGGACVDGTCVRDGIDAGPAADGGTDASVPPQRETCQRNDDCTTSQRCSAVTAGATSGTLAVSYCRTACASDSDCVSPSRCVRMALADGSGNADVCSIPCALATDECASGDTCRPKSLENIPAGDYVTVLECEVFGIAPQGGSCGVADDWRCIAGAICDSRTSTCVELCRDPLTMSSCPSTTSCTPYSSPLVVDGAEWGVCTSP